MTDNPEPEQVAAFVSSNAKVQIRKMRSLNEDPDAPSGIDLERMGSFKHARAGTIEVWATPSDRFQVQCALDAKALDSIASMFYGEMFDL